MREAKGGENLYLNHINSFININNGILFNIINMELFQLEPRYLDVLIKTYRGNNLTKDELQLFEEIRGNCKPNNKISNVPLNLDNIISVKIHVSNDCNLRCSYCYADNGKYGQERYVMDRKTATNIGKMIKKKMPNISNILFFGGEPLMSVDAIETICKIFEDKGVNFLMETNGTIYNEIIHEIIEKYGIKVTVSIDGPKEINDIHRKYPNGKGSYDDIVSNVFKLNKETENVCYLQGTYTKQSSELLDKDEIVNNLYRDLNIPRISIYNVVSKNKDITLTNMKKTAINGEVDKFFDDIFNCNINCNDSLKLILSSILSQSRYLYFCNAGVTQVSIDCNGDIWPCPLFTNKKGYNIGNIFDSIHLINLGFRNASMKLKILNKGNHQDCNNCIASFWCRKCVAESLIKDEAITINKNNCNEHVKLTEELLIKLTEIAMDGKLNEFTQKFEKNYSLELL